MECPVDITAGKRLSTIVEEYGLSPMGLNVRPDADRANIGKGIMISHVENLQIETIGTVLTLIW
jgi:hypothetical protein